jgi:hypothetical protein
MAKQVYVFRAKLKGWHGVRRTIAMHCEQTLGDLHDALQRGFGWDDRHLYAFWLGGKFWAPGEVQYVHPLALEDGSRAAWVAPARATRRRTAERLLRDLHLQPGQRIAYVFDFREEWRVRLTLRELAADDGGHYPRLLESIGEPPPQYLERELREAA